MSDERPQSATADHPRRISPSGQRQGWRSNDIFRAATITVAVVGAAVGLWEASNVVFTVFLGVLFGVAISSGVDRLERLHVPRGIGALLILSAALGILVLIGALMAPVLSEQGREVRSRLPEAFRQAEGALTRLERRTLRQVTGQTPATVPPRDTIGGRRGDSALSVRGPGSVTSSPVSSVSTQVTEQVGGLARHFIGFVGGTVDIIVHVLLMLFVAVYIATDPETYQRGLMHLFPHNTRHRAGEVLSRTATVMRRWLGAQVIAMITLAVVWAIALSVLKVKAAFALAAIAGLLEFVPTIGPTMAVIPSLGMALLDSPAKALTVLLVYLVIQGFEGNLLIPLLMQGRVNLPPALTITFQALMALAFGFVGLMVAVPILATLMVPVKMLYVEDVVGDRVTEKDEAG